MKPIRLIVNAVPMTVAATGIARYMRCLYQELERSHGRELEIAYFDGRGLSGSMPNPPDNLKRWSRAAELFWRLPPRLALGVRLAQLALRERRFLELARGFDLYHEAGYFPFRAPEGVATVFTLHDMSIARHPEHHPRERVLYANRHLPGRARWARRFLAVSEFTRREAVDCLGLDPAAVAVTPLAPSPLFAPRRDGGLRERLAALGLPERYFLFVGSGDPRKNAWRIPPALARAGLAEPLAVAGWSGWAEGAAGGGRVLSLGFVPDETLVDLYSGALGLVYASDYEGFGLPLVEAMACGCPVITARVASQPEVGGDAALYVDDPSDEEALALLLRRLAGEVPLRRELSVRGLAQAARFTWGRTAGLTLDAMREALAFRGQA